MNTAIKIGIGATAAFIGYRLLQLNKLAANVTVSLSKIRVQKVNLAGVCRLSVYLIQLSLAYLEAANKELTQTNYLQSHLQIGLI